jgi:asparagine synthase (glutamine-hydrolysing)
VDALPTIVATLDEPMADASVVPSYILSSFARENVKVVLGGDGGDELFAGYSTLQAHRLAEYYERLPSLVRTRLVPGMVNHLPVSHNNLSFDFKAKRFVAGAAMTPAIRHHRWLGCFFEEEKARLLTDDARAAIGECATFSILDEHLRYAQQSDPLDQILYLDMKMYMEGDILVKVDRMSMANSLETRVPLLNRRLIETVQELPINQKLRRLTRKYVFRHAMAGMLPREIIDRPKKGFGIPMAKWLTNELKPLMDDCLNEERIGADGIFQYSYIRSLVEDHCEGRRDNRMQLWTLILFQLWHARYIGSIGVLEAPSMWSSVR